MIIKKLMDIYQVLALQANSSMKKIALAFISLCCVAYALVALFCMLFQNRTPYTLKAVGLKMTKNRTVAISSRGSHSRNADTVVVEYPKSKAILPSALGHIYHNGSQFILKTNQAISKPDQTQDNFFRPFARTMNEGFFQKPEYFGGNKEIAERFLKQGVKFNSAVGTVDTRVSVQLIEHEEDLFLKTMSEGLGVSYLVESQKPNSFQVVFDAPTSITIPDIFLFKKTATSTNEVFFIKVNAFTFNCEFSVEDATHQVIASGDSSHPKFSVKDILFELTPKYSVADAVTLCITLLLVLGFQFLLISYLSNAKSPVIKSNIAIRIAVNNLFFLAIPIYLTSLYLSHNRAFYLLAVLILNASVFVPVNWLTNYTFKATKAGRVALWVFLLGMPFVMKFFTSGESLFGVVPVLHVQKALVLIMLFSTQVNFLNNWKHKNWGRLVAIVGYTSLISLITHDLGSLIYTTLAFVLVELVKKTITLRVALLSAIGLVALSSILFTIFSDQFTDRKLYRIVAPYVSPDSEKLAKYHQGDRETYSYLLLNLKNLLTQSTPLFNDLVIPGNLRSTCFSDFAFYWSLSLGKWYFLVLFLAVIGFLVSDLILLLFASTRAMRISENESFVLPLNREAEFTRFVVAFTIITFVFPIASNLLLLPLTGQSIPVLSISNIEPVFLAVFLLPIAAIFTSTHYIQQRKVNYQYRDAKKSMTFALFIISGIFALALGIKVATLYRFSDELSWKKEVETPAYNLDLSAIDPNDKIGLLAAAKQLIGDDELTSVDKEKKTLLKNLTSLYYTNRPHYQNYPEGSYFRLSRKFLQDIASVDSIFSAKRRLVGNGQNTPFGEVFSFRQRINEKPVTKYSNKYYSSIPSDTRSIEPNLTAECALALEMHLGKIGIKSNSAAILIIDNRTGGIVANSSMPLYADKNTNETHYLVGSLKKMLVAYCALKIDPAYKEWRYANKSFTEFLQWSDDGYAAALLRDLLQNHPEQLDDILTNDFGLPLSLTTKDSYFEFRPSESDFSSPLDKNNSIYRHAIGQQRPYMFRDAVQWYARVASGLKLKLNYEGDASVSDKLFMEDDERAYLQSALNKVLWGTASNVRIALESNQVNTHGIICKTGTAQQPNSQRNASSSFVLSTERHTIGIMLKGDLPTNNADLAAKNLFVDLIPLFKRYAILKSIENID